MGIGAGQPGLPLEDQITPSGLYQPNPRVHGRPPVGAQRPPLPGARRPPGGGLISTINKGLASYPDAQDTHPINFNIGGTQLNLEGTGRFNEETFKAPNNQ